MGGNSSKPAWKERVKASVEDELVRRMMIQREVQVAVSIARARDTLQIYGTAWATLVAGVSFARLAGKPVPPMMAAPIVVGALALGNLADVAYGNKLLRVAKEAEHIIQNERARLVPMKQAAVARFYSDDEKASMFDPATAAALLWPSSMVSRSFVPDDVAPSKEGKERE